ncbi:MAG: hypothetical protein HRU20_10450 [Pseudomonadales bacterium]|nr:hypothetical protein [Pseudomonadales bacterium]
MQKYVRQIAVMTLLMFFTSSALSMVMMIEMLPLTIIDNISVENNSRQYSHCADMAESSAVTASESTADCCDNGCKTCVISSLLSCSTLLSKPAFKMPLLASALMADHSVELSRLPPPPIFV